MNYRLRDAFRRADCSLAGAVFLSLATAAAMAAYTPTPVSNAPPEPKFRPAILESVSVAEANTPPLAPTWQAIAVLVAADLPHPRRLFLPCRAHRGELAGHGAHRHYRE